MAVAVVQKCECVLCLSSGYDSLEGLAQTK